MSRTLGAASCLRSFHQSSQPTARLLCLPHAGGTAGYFFDLSAALSPAIEVLAVQYPGRQERLHEPPLEDLTGLADEVVAGLARMPAIPLTLFGHSMGALVAFEVAASLQRGPGPAASKLLASAMTAPSAIRPGSAPDGDEALIATLRSLHGTASRLLEDAEFTELFLPAIRADYLATHNYPPARGAVLDCPITAFVGRDDPHVSESAAREWASHTRWGFDLRSFAGDHFYCAGFPPALVAAIQAEVARW